MNVNIGKVELQKMEEIEVTRDEFCKAHWDYYMLLEEDFLTTRRYITFDLGDNAIYSGQDVLNPQNSRCYSIEFIKQYQAICSEVDVLMKSICKEFERSAENMGEYTKIILEKWPNIKNQVIIVDDSIELIPFLNWKAGEEYRSPDWWSPYNKVKHARLDNIPSANLKNVINALGGLDILENYFVKNLADRDNQGKGENEDFIKDVPNDCSKLFSMKNWNTLDRVLGKNSYIMNAREIRQICQL